MSEVLKAISAVMGEVGAVEKRGENKFHGYTYATAADVLHKLQPLMSKHGLTIIQHQKDLSFIQDGNAMAVQYEFDVRHSSGESLDFKPIHTGVASAKTSKGSFDDKAANKCHTGARKYFLLSLFQIPTGYYDDPDADGKEPAEKVKKKDAPNASGKGYSLVDDLGGYSEHGSATAFLDALEGLLKISDDPKAAFENNTKAFQDIQAKAAKAKREDIVGRCAAIFADLAAEPAKLVP